MRPTSGNVNRALDDLERYLSRCVVAITNGDNKGTGFFIAKSTVLTFAHVVEDRQASVEVQWRDQSQAATLKYSSSENGPDLAVLRLEQEPPWDHPCVFLGEEIQPNEQLYIFGHPDGDYREGGDSSTFVFEGRSFEGQGQDQLEYYKFKLGEINPGFSGAPLLNERTGKVCAVARTTRQAESLLGGRGVPIRYLDVLEPNLRVLSEAYHETQPYWPTLLKQLAANQVVPPPAEAPGSRRAPKASSTKAPAPPIAKPPADKSFEALKAQLAASDSNRCGVHVDEFKVEKILGDDGSSEVRYEVKGLSVTRGPLIGLGLRIESDTGCVSYPELDRRAKQANISWRSESAPRSEPMPVEEKLQSVRKLSGIFLFDEPLRSGDPPLTFGWTLRILNGDALSDWEFEHLYNADGQVHMNSVPLKSPMEYFARKIWYPIGTFRFRLVLPDRIEEPPFLSVFKCADTVSVPVDEVIYQGVLQSGPRSASAWVAQNVKWQRDRNAEKFERSALKKIKKGVYEFCTGQPSLGWCYSLDWMLPKYPFDDQLEFLVSQAEEIRAALLEHSAKRKQGADKDDRTQAILQRFATFDREMREEYGSANGNETFVLSLMTYNKSNRRLVMVEGLKNGAEISPQSRDFWLPFGIGLAGACFRNGNQVVGFVRPDKPNEQKPGEYLPFSTSDPYQVLFAVPLDHPNLQEGPEQPGIAERCRQLIGVITIGSTYRIGELAKLGISANSSRVITLRNQCQKLADNVVEIVQTRK